MHRPFPLSRQLLLPLLVGCVACTGGGGAGGPSHERFVEVNVELRDLPDTVSDTTAARAAVLRRHGVSEAELRAFSGRDEEETARAWTEIAARLRTREDSARVAADSLRADSAARSSAVPLGEVPPAQLPAQGGEEGLPGEAN
ncbi:MAG: hypothetical protein M3409_08750 [Gemmatimonadota bacterium]|nr:hypothetical protein [Gemmatimonadota bacterium]